jgi:hypothetical protein
MCGKTRQDKIRNENIGERVGVAPKQKRWWKLSLGGMSMWRKDLLIM